MSRFPEADLFCVPAPQMVSAVIQEDQFEVSLTVSFASAGLKPQQVGLNQSSWTEGEETFTQTGVFVQGGPEGDHGTPTGGGPGPASQTETLSSVTERSTDSIDSNNSQHTHGGRGVHSTVPWFSVS